MGEAKRKRLAVLNGPCPCGRPQAAKLCCFDGRDWHKKPAVLGLRTLPPASRLKKCYMRDLGSCVGPISGEHIISESVIRVLMAAGDFSVSGLPWLEDGQEKILAPRNLTANCLCTKHNSALHPLDDAAKYFFSSLKSYLELDKGTKHALISGHDIERWLLKTAKAAAVSKNLARKKERLSGVFSQDKALLDMLDSPAHWPDGAGLYCTMKTGDFPPKATECCAAAKRRDGPTTASCTAEKRRAFLLTDDRNVGHRRLDWGVILFPERDP